MFAGLRHMAIVSDQYSLLGRFYEAVLKLKSSKAARPERAVVVGDGYVGLNINPRRSGRQAGLDHFGFEVDDVEKVFARLRDKYPSVKVLKRPSTRPFAGLSTHDPAGNVFDLSQRGMENRTDVYEDGEWQQVPCIDHLALRTLIPEALAQFYVDVFELKALEKPADDANFYLTDGRVALVIMPWTITDYEGTGIERAAPEHIGFKVEDVEGFKAHLKRITDHNSNLSPKPIGAGSEGQKRQQLFANCPYGKFHMADPDGVLIDIAAA